MEKRQIPGQSKKPSDLNSDLEAQKLILSKLEDECKKNFLDEKTVNKTLEQYKKAGNELKKSVNYFLTFKSVVNDSISVGSDSTEPTIDEELKEKIDMLEATLKSTGIIKDTITNNPADGSISQITVAPVDQKVINNDGDNLAESSQQSRSSKADSQSFVTGQQPKSLIIQQPSASQSPTQGRSSQQSVSPQCDEKKTHTGKKEGTKKSDKDEAELKLESSNSVSKPEPEKIVSINDSASTTCSKSLPETKELESVSPERKSKSALNKRSAHKEKSTMDYILRNLNSDNNEQNQLKLLCKMYMDLMENNKVLEKGNKQHIKTFTRLNKEKEQLQSENNRLILAKSRLESLCRELQKLNKAIKEESLLRVKEEEEKHRAMAAKFQTTLSEIMTLVQESHQRNTTLRGENMQYDQRLRFFSEHYSKWEKEIEKILASKDLEIQLTKTKLAEANLTSDREREKLIEEKQHILNMVSELHKKNSESIANESHLREELQLYTKKYDEFQTLLATSNEMFNGFKKDMEKMSKQIKDLEKETIRWKKKWEESSRALTVADGERKNSVQKIKKLENLCRALQAERNQLSYQLKHFQNSEKTSKNQPTISGSNKPSGDDNDESQSPSDNKPVPRIVNENSSSQP